MKFAANAAAKRAGVRSCYCCFYHTYEDSIDKMDFKKSARVVAGLEHVIKNLVGIRK